MGPKFGTGLKFVGQNKIFAVLKKLLVQKGLRDENFIT